MELATGVGKSKIAIELVKERKPKTVLIVIPRNVLKQNWLDELKKWYPKCKSDIAFSTYVSFPKHKDEVYDMTIFDECHHLSERCREALCDFTSSCSILLSATVKNSLKDELREVFEDLVVYSQGLRKAINSKILADPKVYLLPLALRTDLPTESIWRNKSAKGRVVKCNWMDRWKYIKTVKSPLQIYCTQRQYLTDLNSQIDYWKRRAMNTRSQIAKTKWLRLCGERLKWLSERKAGIIYELLAYLKDCRTLTLCGSIEQTEKYGEYCINSKNSESLDNLNRFNSGEIDHITSCNMLNEGMNLVDCQVGIYANLNSSETLIKQRLGRLLRHDNPVIIVPYYKASREEEIVQEMMKDYNPELVFTIEDISRISV